MAKAAAAVLTDIPEAMASSDLRQGTAASSRGPGFCRKQRSGGPSRLDPQDLAPARGTFPDRCAPGQAARAQHADPWRGPKPFLFFQQGQSLAVWLRCLVVRCLVVRSLVILCLALPSSVEAQVQCFSDLSLWCSALGNADCNFVPDLERFNTVAANIARADEVPSPPGNNAQLGPTLTFNSANTGLSRSFVLEALQAGADIVFNDTEFGGSAAADTLSIGDFNDHENDDFQIILIGGQGVRALGFFLLDVDETAGESLNVFTGAGSLMGACSGFQANTDQFVGVVTDAPIGHVLFDEDPGGDDITVQDFFFALPPGDVSITKDDGQITATPGDTLTYIIQARNNGPIDAVGATVSDPLSAPLSGCTWTCSGSGGVTCTGSGSGAIDDSVDLPRGTVATYTVTCGTDPTFSGTVTNTASITPPADLADTDSNNNTAMDTTDLVPSADLGLAKDDGVTEVDADSDLTYTLTVSNLGPNDSTGGTVSDTLPMGLSFVSSANGCTEGGGTVSCTFGALSVGSSTALSFVAHIDASVSGTVTNSATVSGNEGDANSGNDSAGHSTEVIAQTDLALSMLDTPDPVVAGTQLTYTLTVTNNGPSGSTGGTVSVALPNALTFASSSDCVAAGSGATCTFGNLASGASQDLILVVDVDEEASGTVSNTATVSGNEEDPVSGNNSASAVTEIIRQVDLEVVKVDGSGGTVVAGETIDYTVTVTNLGPNDVIAATVSDSFPTDLDDVRWNCTASPGSSCPGVGSGNINHAVNLLAMGSVTFSAMADVEPDALGDLINQASASNPAGTEDPDLSNNGSAVTTDVIRQADLRLAKEDASGGETVPGGTLSYRLTVSNDGPSDSSGGSVVDTLPAGTTFRGSASGCTAAGATVTCDFAGLRRGSQRTLIFTVDVAADASGTLSNSATVTGLDADPDSSNNTASASTSAVPRTDLELDKNGPAMASSGDTMVYTLEVTNHGPSDSTGSSVQDSLPAGLTFGGSSDCSASGGEVSCAVGPLAAGASAILSFEVEIGSGVTASLLNSATVTADEDDPASGNNSASHRTNIDAMADLALSKTGSAGAVAGRTLLYTLTVDNLGPADSSGGSVRDTLPPGLSFESSVDGCYGVTGAVVCPFGDLAQGTSHNLTFVARLASSADGTLLNQSTVDGNEVDPVSSNDDASLSTAVTRQADLSLSKDDGVTSVTPGNTLQYSLTVRNLGPSDSGDSSGGGPPGGGGQIIDPLPSGLSFASSPDGCALAGGDVVCPFGPLAAGQERTLRFTVAVAAGVDTEIDNSATVSGPETDPETDNNVASHLTPLAVEADLALSKDDGVTQAVAGEPLTYTLTIDNLGPSTGGGGVITDTLPLGMSFASSADGCSAVGAVVSCPFGAVAVGGSEVRSFVVDLAADLEGDLVNRADLQSDDHDPNPANDSAIHQTPVVRRADLELSKDDGVASAAPGETLTYALTVDNLGPSDCSGATVDDPLPAGLTFLSSEDGCQATDGVVRCAVPPLASGSNLTLSFKARLDSDLPPTPDLVNDAEVVGLDDDPDPLNNLTSHSTPLGPRADLAITKDDGLTAVAPGSAHTYTITVRNLGPSDAEATVTDTLPTELSQVSWTCQASPGSSCNSTGNGDLDDDVDLAAGGVLVYTVSSTVGGSVGGMLNNTATVESSIADPYPDNNTDEDLTSLAAIADLRLSKDDGQSVVAPGSTLTYTITVDNDGPSPVIDALVEDTLPPTLSNVSWTCQPSAGAVCSASDLGNLSDTVDLPPGGRLIYRVVATVAPDAVGLLVNSAQVTPPAGVTDPNPGNNGASDINTLDPTADLLLSKSDGQATAAPGETLTYDVTVQNIGPGDAAGAQVVDLLPALLQGATWTCTPSVDAVCTATGSGNLLDTVVLPAGGQLLYQITGTVAANALAAGHTAILNTASVTPPPGLDDPAPSNNSASDLDTLQASHDLVLSKDDGVLQAVPGGQLTYAVVVQNLGPSDAAGPQVHDPLPAGLSCVWSCVASHGASCFNGQLAGDLLDHPSLPALSEVTYTGLCQVAANLDPATTPQLVNGASVAVPLGAVDPVPANNSDNDINTLTPLADLGVTKSDGVTAAIPGQSVLSYALRAHNAGPSDVAGAQLRDTFPAGLDCLWSCTAGTGASCPAGQHSGDLLATVDLTAGASLVVNAQCHIDPELSGTLSNTLSITPPAGVVDPNPNNDSARDLDTVLTPTAQLAVSKSDQRESLAPGEALTYLITVQNLGPSDALDITVHDALPPSLEAITWSCDATDGSSCSAVGGDDLIDPVTVRAGGQLTYSLEARVRANTAAGMLSNTVSLSLPSGIVDPQPADNSATDNTTLTPTVDLAISKDDGLTSAVPGTSLRYVLTVTNGGPSDAVDARVTDTLPEALSNAVWTCLPSPGASCSLSGSGDLDDLVRVPVGGQLLYRLDATVDGEARGELLNGATVQAAVGTVDSDPSNNSASDLDTLTPRADLRLSKTDNRDSVAPGHALTYRLELHNDGPSDVVGATVQDVVPTVLDCAWSCNPGPGTGCAVGDPASGDLQGSADLPAGGAVVYEAQCQVDAAASGVLLNQASATLPGGVEDPDPTDNLASDSTDLLSSVDLVISKNDGRNSASPGDTLTYNLVVSNPFGPSDVRGATVEDVFPASLSCVWGCQGTFGAVCTPGQVSGDLLDVVDLPVGSQAIYTALCQLADDASGGDGNSVINVATVTPPAGVIDSNPSNNTAQDITDISSTGLDLSIQVSDGLSSAVPGTSITYILLARQLAGPPTSGIVVRDDFPAELDCLWSCQALGGGSCAAGQHAGDLLDTVHLVSGASLRYTARCDIDPSARGSLANPASIEPPSGVADANPSDNGSSDLDTVLLPRADLQVTKSDGLTNVLPGGELTYDIEVRNVAGPSTLLGGVVEDLFADQLSCSWTCDLDGEALCTAGPVSGDLLDTVELPPGESLVYRATCQLAEDAVGTLRNTAHVRLPPDFLDPVPANNSATDETLVQQVTDLVLRLEDGTAEAVPGEQLTFVLTVENFDSFAFFGPGGLLFVPATTVRGLLVQSAPPEALSCVWTCQPSDDASCDPGPTVGDLLDSVDLAAGSQVVYSARCHIDPAARGILTNQAELLLPAGVVDLDPSNNSASDSLLLTPRADLQLSKSDGITQAAPGGEVTYLLTAANPLGPSEVQGARLTDAFAATLDCLWSCQGAPVDGGRCDAGIHLGDVDVSVDLPVGSAVTVQAVCRIAPSASGMLSNTAHLAPPGEVDDPNPTNNTASDLDTTLLRLSDLSLSLSDGRLEATPGGGLSYGLLARNDGPSDLFGATLSDDLPDTLSCAWSCGSLGGASCDGSLPDGDLSTQVDLPVGSSVLFTARCQIDADARGTLINGAVLSLPGDAVDPDPSNNQAVDDDTVLVPVADLAIDLDNGFPQVVPGTSVSYTLRLDNLGPSSAVGATLATSEPFSVDCQWSCQPDAGATCPTAPQAGPLGNVVDLPAGGGVTYTGLCQVGSAALGSLGLSAQVSPAGDTQDPYLDNNLSDDTDPLTPQADLSISKDDGVDEVAPGETVTYDLVVHNAGPSDAPGATVSDHFVASLSCAWDCLAGPGAGCSAGPQDGDLLDLAHLPAGGGVTYRATCQVASDADGTLLNQAQVTAPQGVQELNPGNNSDSDLDSLTPQADLWISKDDGRSSVDPGDSVSYLVVVGNDGPSDAAGVTVEDVLPPELSCSWSCDTPSSGCTAEPPDGDLLDSLDLEAGQQVTYTALCRVADEASGEISNGVTVSAAAGLDPSLINNSASDVNTVGQVADLSVVMADDPDPVAPGEILAYGIEVHNFGPAAAPQVLLEGLLPSQVTFLGLGDLEPGSLFFDGFEIGDLSRWDSAASAGSGSTGTAKEAAMEGGSTTDAGTSADVECSANDGLLSCQLGSLAADASRQVVVLVQVASEASGVLIHSLTVSGPGQDPDSSNNTASSLTNVSSAAGDLEIVATPQAILDKTQQVAGSTSYRPTVTGATE